MALIGYARVSTEDQSLDMQLDALEQRGCAKVFAEKLSGKTKERPQLEAMLEYLRDDEDTVVIYKLDRLGRSMRDLLEITETLANRGIGLVSIKDGIDMTTATGRLYFHLMACLSEFERDLISERTKAGLEAARARGRKGGRKAADPEKLRQAFILYDTGSLSVDDVCTMAGISRSTFFKYNRQRQERAEKEQQ